MIKSSSYECLDVFRRRRWRRRRRWTLQQLKVLQILLARWKCQQSVAPSENYRRNKDQCDRRATKKRSKVDFSAKTKLRRFFSRLFYLFCLASRITRSHSTSSTEHHFHIFEDTRIHSDRIDSSIECSSDRWNEMKKKGGKRTKTERSTALRTIMCPIRHVFAAG